MVDKISLSHLAYSLLKPQAEPVNDEMHFIASSEDVKVRLKFISHIQKDQKVDTKNLKLQNNGYLCSLTRFVYPDNRMNTIKFIKDVMSRTFEILEYYRLSNRTMDLKMLLEDLIRAIKGLNNLKETYEKDTLFLCYIDSITESIRLKLSSLNIKEEIVESPSSAASVTQVTPVTPVSSVQSSPSIMSVSSNTSEISQEELP